MASVYPKLPSRSASLAASLARISAPGSSIRVPRTEGSSRKRSSGRHWDTERWRPWVGRPARAPAPSRGRQDVPFYRDHWAKRRRQGDRASAEQSSRTGRSCRSRLFARTRRVRRRAEPRQDVRDRKRAARRERRCACGNRETLSLSGTRFSRPGFGAGTGSRFRIDGRRWAASSSRPSSAAGRRSGSGITACTSSTCRATTSRPRRSASTSRRCAVTGSDICSVIRRRCTPSPARFSRETSRLRGWRWRSAMPSPCWVTSGTPSERRFSVRFGTPTGRPKSSAGPASVRRGRCTSGPRSVLRSGCTTRPMSPVSKGHAGRMICTALLSSHMPLIRYSMGDRSILSIEDRPCGCGRSLPRIRSFEGRTADVMLTPDGSPVGVLDTIFDVDMPIREAQIIQESLHSIRVRVVPGRGFGDRHRRSLARGVRMRMGPNVEVPIETVESIPRTKAGKFQVQVSMLDRRTRRGTMNANRCSRYESRHPHPVLPPEMGAPQARLSHLAEQFVRRGHEVVVLTAMPSYPQGKVFPGYGGFVRKETRGGASVIRCALYPTNKVGLAPRLASYFSFVVSSLLVGDASLPRLDFLLTESPPLFLGNLGLPAGSAHGRALDLQRLGSLAPERGRARRCLRGVGAPSLEVPGGVLLQESLARDRPEPGDPGKHPAAFSRSERLPSLQRGRHRAVPSRAAIPRRPRESRERAAPDATCVALYGGLHGIAQGLDQILEAASRLRDVPSLAFALVGDGPVKAALQARARELGLTNVRFLDAVPREKMPALVASADLALVPLKSLCSRAPCPPRFTRRWAPECPSCWSREVRRRRSSSARAPESSPRPETRKGWRPPSAASPPTGRRRAALAGPAGRPPSGSSTASGSPVVSSTAWREPRHEDPERRRRSAQLHEDGARRGADPPARDPAPLRAHRSALRREHVAASSSISSACRGPTSTSRSAPTRTPARPPGS